MAFPAHITKHIPLLSYPFLPSASTFSLTQLADGQSNGTALWLGAQCLSLYLASLFKPPHPLKVIELGSGIGLTALALGSLGCDVLATDIPHVISTVLTKNIRNNLSNLPPTSGSIQVREFDWTIPPNEWIWGENLNTASQPGSSFSPPFSNKNLLPPYDLICTADTVYKPSLVDPLLRTLHGLCMLSVAASAQARAPPIYVCIERRDPILVDHFLSEARIRWNFTVNRVPNRKLAKALHKGGIMWAKEEWEDVEIWKLTLSHTHTSSSGHVL